MWNSRNEQLHVGHSKDPLQLVSMSLNFLCDSQKACPKISLSLRVHLPSGPLLWHPRECGFYKVNFDGAVFKETNSYGVGVVVRDFKGRFVVGFCQKFYGLISLKTVEMRAAHVKQ